MPKEEKRFWVQSEKSSYTELCVQNLIYPCVNASTCACLFRYIWLLFRKIIPLHTKAEGKERRVQNINLENVRILFSRWHRIFVGIPNITSHPTAHTHRQIHRRKCFLISTYEFNNLISDNIIYIYIWRTYNRHILYTSIYIDKSDRRCN